MSITFLSLKKGWTLRNRVDFFQIMSLMSATFFRLNQTSWANWLRTEKKRKETELSRFVGAIVSSFLPSKSHLHTKLLVELSA